MFEDTPLHIIFGYKQKGGSLMNNVRFVLYSYKKTRSKKQDKDLLVLNCIFNNDQMFPIFMSYSETNEEFCKNFVGDDITQYVSLRLTESNAFIAYIKIL